MNFTKYNFKTWDEFNSFILANKDKILDKQIDEYYCQFGMSDMSSDEPIVLVIGDVCIFIYYLFLSSVKISIFSKDTFKKDPTMNFLYKDIPGSSALCHYVQKDEEFPLYGLRIEDITLDYFSKSFDINPSTSETRPEGRNYFSVIRFHFKGGSRLCICAASSVADGYTDVWFE